MAGKTRATGPAVGINGAQSRPSHIQVSPNSNGKSNPPKSTVAPIALSYTIACSLRAGGTTGDTRGAQSTPSHAQVSSNAPAAPNPPKSRVVSLAIS